MDPLSFWKWVTKNLDRLTTHSDESVFDELADQLGTIDTGLVMQFTASPGALPTLAISCDGDEELIPLVRTVTEAAPALPGLRVVAFAQRLDPKELALELEGVVLKASGVWFRLIADADEIDRLALTLFVDVPKMTDSVADGCVIIAESVLGELDFMTRIGTIEVETLPANRKELSPLSKLAATFDGWDR